MGLTIGICDDCPDHVKLIRNFLDRYKDGFILEVISSSNPEEFLSKIKENKPDLVFLDIDMDGLNGIELGEKIKKEYNDTVIVYITAYEQYAFEAFQVRAFHYLIKPLTEEKFSQFFKEVVELLGKKSDKKTDKKVFTVQKKGEIICLDYDDICCFEKIRHKIKVYTVNSIVEFYGSFKSLLNEIDTGLFVKCHQGYIINKDKIKGYKDKTLTMEGNVQIPVSRSYIFNVKEMLAERLLSGKDY